MIKSLNILLLIGTMHLGLNAQDSSFSNLGSIVEAYLESTSNPKFDERFSQYSQLFTTHGRITSVNNSVSQIKRGSWDEFLNESKDFYSKYSIQFNEVQREVDYYLEVAVVRIIVEQMAKDISTGKTYLQEIWIQLDLIYYDDRWFVDSVLWTSDSRQKPTIELIKTDTLWYKNGG